MSFSPRVTHQEAVTLMVFHLSMVCSIFEVLPLDPKKIIQEINEKMDGDWAAASNVFLETLEKQYKEMK